MLQANKRESHLFLAANESLMMHGSGNCGRQTNKKGAFCQLKSVFFGYFNLFCAIEWT
jgi:hypothetical protein